MSYHLTGFLSSIIFLLTIGGLWAQLRLLWRRRARSATDALGAGRPTALLSLNQFVSSFLAFFSFLFYGASLTRFNHYLVWSRSIACLLTLVVLFEIMRDRRQRNTIFAFFGCLFVLAATPLVLRVLPQAAESTHVFSQGLVVLATALLAQGYAHQIVLIRRTGRTGGVSLRMHQFFLLKDVSTIAFATAMGWAAGWPLLFLSALNVAIKAITLWHFRWVRRSPLAARRRTLEAAELDLPWPPAV